MKRRIVCFGDSNTWGFNPITFCRYDENTRWTGLLQKKLGNAYQIIEEGQNGRTLQSDDPWEGEKNGSNYIIPCIESHRPFDLLIIMLGTNDCKEKFALTAQDISGGLEQMIIKIKGFLSSQPELSNLKLLIIAPASINPAIKDSNYYDMFREKGKLKSEQLSSYYHIIANKYDCDYINISDYIQAGSADCIHLDEDGHKILSGVIKQYVQKLFT